MRAVAGAAHRVIMTNTESLTRTFAIGDEVTADPALFGAWVAGIVYVIEKVPTGARGVNYVAKPKGNPTGRGVRCPAYALRPYDPTAPAATATMIPYMPTPEMGAVVTVADLRDEKDGALFVVLGDAKKPNAVRLVRLGGDNGRYYPAIPVSRVTVVDPARITVTP